MTVIDRPWLHRDDDGLPRFKTSWHEEDRGAQPQWPGPAKRKRFEPHDAQTTRLIERLGELERLEHGEQVAPLIEHWQWLDRMAAPGEKQQFLEPLIEQVRRAPKKNEGLGIFLLLVCEGTRRGVARELVAARFGLEGSTAAPGWHRREESKRLDDMERDRLHDVTRQAVVEAIYGYPSPPPRRFFGWLRETVAHRTLGFLSGELTEIEVASHRRSESEAIQAVLGGLEGVDGPTTADRPGLRRWEQRMLPLYRTVEKFSEVAEVREVCRTAVTRLPPKQQVVIERHFYEGLEPQQIAAEAGVSRSTVYNHKAQALRTLHEDDCFFMALCGLRIVRDSARRLDLLGRHPDGRLQDGRRIVYIDAAA
jgi:RNA polymerase sigma factor (sigma-70 family)